MRDKIFGVGMWISWKILPWCLSLKKKLNIYSRTQDYFFPDAACIFAYFVKIRHCITTQQASASQFNYNYQLGPFKVIRAFVQVGLYKNVCEIN